MEKTKETWWLSLIMLVCYLAIFHLWMALSPIDVMISGIVWAGVFGGLISSHKSYFVDRLDMNAHRLVVLDIVLEAVLIPVHDNYGFYLCATAFAGVIGWYRMRALSKR